MSKHVGGAMARPKKEEKKVQYTVMIEPSLIKEIKELAKKQKMPPGTLARNCLKIGLDDVRMFERAGIIRLVGSSRRQVEKMKKKFDLDFDGLDVLNGE
jgi:hypothetical protein